MRKSELNLNILKNSFLTLKECYHDYTEQKDTKIKEYIKDSCVKRFEYTYETAKKIMNKYLKKEFDKTEQDLTINNIFRQMYGLSLISSFENWVDYREKRNDTSHEYSQEKSGAIIEIIPRFLADTDFLISALELVLVDD